MKQQEEGEKSKGEKQKNKYDHIPTKKGKKAINHKS